MDHGMENRRIKQSLTIFTLLCFITLFSQGCISHFYTYKFGLDGNCDFSYEAKGDSADIYNPLGTYPESPFFVIETSTEVDSSGNTVFILQASRRFPPDSLPTTLGLREVPWTNVFLQHPAELKKTNLLFASIYKFKCTFKGRDLINTQGDRWKYIPPECKILETDADSTLSEDERAILEKEYLTGLLIWNTERYKLRFREIIKRVLTNNPEVTVPVEWVDSALVEVDYLIETYASGVELESTDFSNLEWWDDIAPDV